MRRLESFDAADAQVVDLRLPRPNVPSGSAVMSIRLHYSRGKEVDERRPHWQFRAHLFGGIILLASLIVGTILFGDRPRGYHDSLRCVSNLRQIALACIIYAGDHNGQFPDTAGTLLSESDLTGEAFICPLTPDVRAPGPTTQQYKQQLNSSGPPGSGGCCSYVYVGGGLTSQSPPNAVVAYEPPGHHASRPGGAVVYADGRAEWLGPAELQAVITALNAGQNPPP